MEFSKHLSLSPSAVAGLPVSADVKILSCFILFFDCKMLVHELFALWFWRKNCFWHIENHVGHWNMCLNQDIFMPFEFPENFILKMGCTLGTFKHSKSNLRFLEFHGDFTSFDVPRGYSRWLFWLPSLTKLTIYEAMMVNIASCV